ncbi:MAG TPA: hypothetical protein VF179_20580 [Thermoanaerobaculia bacterium]|nr:hypothetical protein [Thermoanaerobaculia bacterium]
MVFGQPPAPTPEWAVDPQDPGPSLPPSGHSLFDFLTGHEGVPFPFSALLDRIEERLGGHSLKKVLIPLGRSLQRNAADPEFFRYPRAVAAVDTDGVFKDRLYLGYHEKAAVLEVISYNEAAGRFEFQLVLDYRPGGAARVVYANRAVCTACHQGGGPLFSRQVWDETNANPEIARLLAAEKRDFYGFPIAQGVDVPAAIDAATDRANRIAVYQLLWREGCGSDECRAAAFTSALQHRLSGGLHEGMGEELQRAWQVRWPHGLAIPDPDIPNRDPLASHRSNPVIASVPATLSPEESRRLGGLVLRSHVPAAFEPLNPRPPLEVWTKDTGPERLIAGLAGFLTNEDARRLDSEIFSRGKVKEQQTFPCEVSIQPRETGKRVKFRCTDALEGRIFLEGAQVVGGTIERLGALRDLDVIEGKSNPRELKVKVAQKLSGLHARGADGNAVESLRLSYSGEAIVTFLDDFSVVKTAIDDLPGEVFSSAPFRRTAVIGALFKKLGLETDACCLADASLPPPVLETGGTVGPADFPEPAVQALYRYCGNCHAKPEVSPPNFLYGDVERVRGNLARCAERIFYRLDLWRLPVPDRSKTPMPPVHALSALGLAPGDPRLALLRQHAAGLLRKETGKEPRLEDLETRGYESLRSCLQVPLGSPDLLK